MNPIEIIKSVSQKTDSIILFHSGAGKDSIALSEMINPYFKRVVCCFMYVIPNLQHINNYIAWTKSKYNYEFIELPHYSLGSIIKSGFMGIKPDPKQKLYKLADITDRARQITGIQWAMFGFKQSDSLNRRLMLRTYDNEAISWDTKKVYPLSNYLNSDVLKYIDIKGLPKPLNYGGKHQSSGTAINDINFLIWCKNNAPDDLVNHKDGNKRNVNVINLEYNTGKQNIIHAWKTGLNYARTGEDAPNAKLTNLQVEHIRELYKGGLKIFQIADLFSVTRTTIHYIVHNITHKKAI